MLIIDRYILRQFVQTFAICFCSLTGLYIVIDAFGNLEEFINYSKQHGGLLAVMGQYYAYRALTFFDRTGGILTLISAVFTVTWLTRHNELTALEAAGLSKGRIVRPVIVAVAGIALVGFLNRELAIPAAREVLAKNAQDLAGRAARTLQPRYDNRTDISLGGKETFADEKRISKPSFLLPAGLDDYGKQLVAKEAFYRPATARRPAGYLLVDVERPIDLDRQPSLSLKGRTVIYTPADTPWLQPGECFVASDVDFEQLAGGAARQLASTAELIRSLRNPSLDLGADVRVAVHSRMVQPVLDVTLLFLGLPLVLARGNRNVFAAIGLCGAVALVFMVVVLGCQYLGTNYLISPALAAWLPVMIFVPWAAFVAGPLVE